MPAGLQILSNEILHEILDHIDADPERAVNFDRRAYLSVESFRPPQRLPAPRAQDIASFRLTCRRFAQLGEAHQFTKIATRFSHRGLERLEWIASQKHLAKHAKKFSYLIPLFYVEGRARVRELIQRAHGELQLDPFPFEAKAEAQMAIVRSKEDVRVLKKAMQAFTSLQHVQVLRLQDQTDSSLLEYLFENTDFTNIVDLRWPLACTHASRTIGNALLAANSPVTRLSGPMMTLDSVADLQALSGTNFFPLAEKLTCLELHFDDAADLTNRVRRLSGCFESCFRAARNMQALHLGFPSRAPLDLSLETVFHNIKWEKLRAFGVQAWRLHGHEILSFVHRHRNTLRGLRLRDVQLRRGSWWKDVLASLRENTDRLEWVSLRRIDYEENFDALWSGSIEIPAAWPAGLESDSEESDEGNGFHGLLDLSEIHIHDYQDVDGEEQDTDSGDAGSTADTDDISNADSDDGPQANVLALAPDPTIQIPSCTCEKGGFSAAPSDLGDNGNYVIYQQRKFWEKWVVGRCAEHDKMPDGEQTK